MQLNPKWLQTDILVGNSILDFKSVHNVTGFDEKHMLL